MGADTGGTYRRLIRMSGGNTIAIGADTNDIICQASITSSNDNGYVCGWNGRAWQGVASYNFWQQSDRRLKTDIADLPDCLDLVRRLTPQRYRWHDGPDTARMHYGFIAQEVGAVIGEDFGGYDAATPDDPMHAHAGIAYNQLVAAYGKPARN